MDYKKKIFFFLVFVSFLGNCFARPGFLSRTGSLERIQVFLFKSRSKERILLPEQPLPGSYGSLLPRIEEESADPFYLPPNDPLPPRPSRPRTTVVTERSCEGMDRQAYNLLVVVEGMTSLHRLWTHGISATVVEDVFCRKMAIYSLLGDEKVPINARDSLGRTALHCALEANDLMGAMILVSCGANPLEQDYNGQTTLHYAAKCRNWWPFFEHVECEYGLIILALGYVIFDNYNKTFLDVAQEFGSLEIKGNIDSRFSDVVDPFFCIDERGRTTLHYAAILGNEKAFCMLLNHGVNPLVQDNSGKTAFHYAAERSRFFVFNLVTVTCLRMAIAMRDCEDKSFLDCANEKLEIRRLCRNRVVNGY